MQRYGADVLQKYLCYLILSLVITEAKHNVSMFVLLFIHLI